MIPAYNHARYLEAALESLFAQTYRNVEIMLIDDGSTDDTADVARRTLERSPFPHRMIHRANRGAARTLNEAFELASAPYVNVLNSDDMFETSRLQMMVDQVAATGASWGFSAIAFIDAAGGDVDLLHDPRAYPLACSISAVPAARSTGFALLAANVVVSSGNLFCSRALWRMLADSATFATTMTGTSRCARCGTTSRCLFATRCTAIVFIRRTRSSLRRRSRARRRTA